MVMDCATTIVLSLCAMHVKLRVKLFAVMYNTSISPGYNKTNSREREVAGSSVLASAFRECLSKSSIVKDAKAQTPS